MNSLRGKTAVITGGSRGIGLAIAQHFARLGASTILVGRDNVTLRAAVESVQKQPVYTIQTPSATDSPSAPSLATSNIGPSPPSSTPAQQKQSIDILVNCAGVSQGSLLKSTSLEDIDKILDTNLKSAVLGCKYIGAHMMRRSGPSIINVSSVMAMRGGVGAAVYAATKAGLLGLTSSLSVELGQFGIRVNALVPGYIDTSMIQNFSRDALTRHIPLKRTGLVSEVADAAAFLAQNTYANNCVLTLDGGLTASMLSG
ncbi:hypothetical protein BD289DRAFT_361317 [Coniella lustricola]|uniref:3-oxoacyl-reductase n=1 Tax=Coniella lustricola TaxID=2025994 RepID=A0A2T3AIM3_9PEZI|nr:hypothetical protein BD289DRAFT_361317 [Coniella lustricola]